MSEHVLYYQTSTSENLGSQTSEEVDETEATPSYVKNNYVYLNYKTREPLVGTMPINEAETIKLVPSTSSQLSYYTIPQGYHTGFGKVIAPNIADYTYGTATAEDIAENKIAWVNGERLVGTLDISSVKQDGNATENDIMDTRTAWVKGKKITGKIPWLYRKDVNLYAGQTYTFPYGLSPGTSVISAVSLEIQTQANATAKDLLSGKTAWVKGSLISGTIDLTEDAASKLDTTDALTTNVLAGKKFYSSILGAVAEGSMTDHSGEDEIVLNPGNMWYIPEGYYNGLSHVRIPALDSLTIGDATEEDILVKKVAWVNGKKVTGTMIFNDPKSISIGSEETYTIPQGYHDGNGTVTAKGIAPQTEGTATKSDILKDKTAWVNGEKITGNIETYGNIDVTLNGDEHYHIPQGYHDGTGWVWANSISKQTEGTATHKDILNGKTAWVYGVKITGDMEEVTPVTKILDLGEKFVIKKGYHDGTGWVQSKSSGEITPGDATETDIIKGKTAWVNGVKITGSLDFSLADADPSDVAYGKTFYNKNGLKTGTLELEGTATPEQVALGYTFYNTDLKTIQTGTMKLTGTAYDYNVLEGKTFYNSDPSKKVTGSMPNIGSESETLLAGSSHTISKGYHDGTGIIKAEKLDTQTPGTATADQILKGKTAWVNGEKITGNIETRSGYSATLSAGESITFQAGYYPNGFTIRAQDLASQTIGTATKDDIVIDKTAWVNGEQLTGTIPDGDSMEY